MVEEKQILGPEEETDEAEEPRDWQRGGERGREDVEQSLGEIPQIN